MAKEMRFDIHSLNSKAYIANDHTNDSFFFMLKVWVIFVSFFLRALKPSFLSSIVIQYI